MKEIRTVFDPATFLVNGKKLRAIAHESSIYVFYYELSAIANFTEKEPDFLDKDSKYMKSMALFINDQFHGVLVIEIWDALYLLQDKGKKEAYDALYELLEPVFSRVTRTDGRVSYEQIARIQRAIDKFAPEHRQLVMRVLKQDMELEDILIMPASRFYEAMTLLNSYTVKESKVMKEER